MNAFLTAVVAAASVVLESVVYMDCFIVCLKQMLLKSQRMDMSII